MEMTRRWSPISQPKGVASATSKGIEGGKIRAGLHWMMDESEARSSIGLFMGEKKSMLLASGEEVEMEDL